LPQSRAVIMEATSYSQDRIPVAKSECIIITIRRVGLLWFSHQSARPRRVP